MAGVPPPPPSLKTVAHHYKTATEMDKIGQPVVGYYCRMYVLQAGMEIDKSSGPAKQFLFALMGKLEEDKAALVKNELFTDEMTSQAYCENYALTIFAQADTEDRAGQHDKNVVKKFYTAGMLFDVLSVFGEPPEDIEKYKKYAKYKATYIHKCLKSGVAPTPGPIDEEGRSIDIGTMHISDQGDASGYSQPQPGPSQPYNTQYPTEPPVQPSYQPQQPQQPSYQPQQPQQPNYPPQQPVQHHQPKPVPAARPTGPPAADGGAMIPTDKVDWDEAAKNTRFAMSSMTYEDREPALKYLQIALNLLKYGHV